MLEPSETVAEKLHVLEAIDKKLRQGVNSVVVACISLSKCGIL